MATLYDQAGAVVATGFEVLNESRLTQRRTDVVHDLALGGLPYVVQKDPSGLGGNIEFLCPSGEMADAIYAAHLGGRLRLDSWQRQNLVKDPHLASASWTQAGSTGTLTHATTGGPNGHGYFEYAMDTVNTASPMSIPVTDSGINGIPVAPGRPFIVSSYWWQSINQNVQRYDVNWYNATGTFISGSSSPDEILPGEPPETWHWEDAVFTPVANAAFARLLLSWSQTYSAPQTLRVADVLVEYGTELRPWFAGDAPNTASLVNRWSGVENASVSNQYDRPALDFTYLPVGGVGIPVKSSRNYWRVSVPNIQERP